ncbi:hypothetical protein [Rubrivivax albus]|uniref:DUF3301 domain-containing protein n=1 Tax=Rubrivivax albus TaxID=2499835 RepID=A0A437JK85_9BURK|nr:hypothetical protein [Rubrivivax albus]RVT47049.1 hypothetical protein ENE75_24450 [Rubrivivax albus]
MLADLAPYALVCVAAVVAWVVISELIHTRRLDRIREEAIAAFRSATVEAEEPRLKFRGSDALILKVEESPNPHRNPAAWFTLTIFARNEHFEYFMFKSTRPKPLVKHMSHRIAKHMLGDKYEPPPLAEA